MGLDKKEYKIPLAARKGGSEKPKWYYKPCSSRLASKLRLGAKTSVEFSAEPDTRHHQEWANKMCKRFEDFDVASSGKLSRRNFFRVLEIEGFVLLKSEKKLLASLLDFNHDGSVHWKEFVEFFENNEVGMMAATAHDEPWYATQADVVDKIITMMQQQQSNSSRGRNDSDQHYSKPLLTLQQKFESYAMTMTGYVKWEEFAASFKDCYSLNLNLEPFELKRLFLALEDKHGKGQANYKDLLDFLIWWGQRDEWHKIAPAIAGNILKAMGIEPMQRYSWLSRLKTKLYEIDHSRIGVVCEKSFLEALKECGVHFTSQSEQRRLLNILTETNNNKESVSKSHKADVPYEPVIAFCAAHAGHWQDAYPLLRDQIKNAMHKRAASSSCSKPIWCIFSQFGKSGSGTISGIDFSSALHQLGLGDLSFSDRSVITQIVVDQQHEPMAISYACVVRALAEFDPLYKTDQALAAKLLRVLGECLGSSSAFSPEFDAYESCNTKRIPTTRKEKLKRAVSKIAAAHGGSLTETDLERLVICVGSSNSTNIDIFVSAYELMNSFVSGHLGAWVEQVPHIATDLAFQFGLLPNGLTAISNMKRLLQISDRGGRTGKCGPVAFKRCLNGAGLDLNDVEINDIMRITAGGGNYIAYEVIVNFLCNMCNSTSGFETPDNEAAAPLVKHLLEEFREGVQNTVLQDGGRKMNLGLKASRQSLRRLFNRLLDTRGSGFIDLGDLVLALPEFGIIGKDTRWSRGNVQLMLTTLASQNHGPSGQGGVTFNEFSSFIISGLVDSDGGGTRESVVGKQQRQAAVRTSSTRNTTSALHSDSHQLAIQSSAAIENVKKRLGIHNRRKLQGVSSLSKLQEALDRMDPSFTGRLNPSKARARLAKLLHIKDTPLLQKDWNAFVDTLDQD